MIQKVRAVLVVADDWEGLYINDGLIDEGHTVNEGESRLKYFADAAKQYNFSIDDLEEMDVSEDYYENYLSLYGNLHSSYSEMLQAQ